MHRITERTATKQRLIIWICLIWAGLSCSGRLFAQSNNINSASKKSCIVPNEEVDVYVAYELYQHMPAVIVTETQVAQVGLDGLNYQLSTPRNDIPVELQYDFKRKNKSSCTIQSFTGVYKLRFISEADKEQTIPHGGVTWKQFEQKYGDGTELNLLSRVGFNSTKTLALLYVCTSADGALYMLVRKRGRWVVEWRALVWAT